ncbi:MAG: hypothetical protein AAEJ04_08780 [Planctomycetota bacterium]
MLRNNESVATRSAIFLGWLMLLCLDTVCGSYPTTIIGQASTAPLLANRVDDDPVGHSWLSPEEGLARALEMRQPVLLVLKSPADIEPFAALEEELLQRSTARVMEKVVAIRVLLEETPAGIWQWQPREIQDSDQSPSDRPSSWTRARVLQLVEKQLGKPKGHTTIAILDLFGRKKAQLDGKKISGSALRKGLKLATRECQLLAKKMIEVARRVDKATLLLQKEDTAGCCRQLQEAAQLKLPLEAPCEKRRQEVLGIVEKQWREAMAQAKELERKNQLGEAAALYEKILKDFPHDPWEKEVREAIGKVWRRIQGPGGGI